MIAVFESAVESVEAGVCPIYYILTVLIGMTLSLSVNNVLNGTELSPVYSHSCNATCEGCKIKEKAEATSHESSVHCISTNVCV